VAAFNRAPNAIGRDIGEIIGGDKIGIAVQDAKNAGTILKELREQQLT
jgi:hypothetical protein